MRRFWLLLVLVLPLAGMPATVASQGAAQAPKDEPEKADDEPLVSDKLDKVTLTVNPGGHTATITKVFFTPDSEQVITVSADHSIRLWDARSGLPVKVLYPPGFGGIGAAALSPDGKTLAVGSRYPDGDKTLHLIYLVSLTEGRIKGVLKGHPQAIEALAFSADGKRLASTSAGPGEDGVLIWDPAKDKPEQKFKFNGAPSSIFREVRRGLAFSPNGSRLACVRFSGGAGHLLDLSRAKPKSVARLWGMGPVAWSPNGDSVATAMTTYPATKYPGKGIMLWKLDGTPLRRIGDLPGCDSLAFSADARTLLATWGGPNHSRGTGIFEVATGKQLVKAADVKGPKAGALSSDGKLAATVAYGNGRYGMTVWNAEDGKIVKEAWPKPSIVRKSQHTGWSAGGQAVTWPGSHSTSIFNLVKLEFGPRLPAKAFQALAAKDFQGPREGAALAALNGYCKTLVGTDRAAYTWNGVIFLVEAATGKEIRRLHGHHDEVNELVPSKDGRFLLSTSRDQTLKIWNLEGDRPLLSLYVQGNDDWVVWTEEGYYAATPGGERLIGWKVDNGVNQMPTFYPAERFHKQLYRPDVIKLLLEKGSVAKALATANAELEKKGKKVAEGMANLNKLLPPKAFLEVLDKKNLPTLKVKVRAVAAVKNQPVKALRLMLDGRPLTGQESSVEFKDGKENVEDIEWTITLPGEKATGPYQLAVLARGPDAASLSEAVAVSYLDPKKLPVMHVLAIGINNYKDGPLKLAAARPDAEDIAANFEKCAKGELFQAVSATTLLDEKADRPAILKALDELRTKNKVKANDLVVVFFAGHGLKNKNGFYLLPTEADITNEMTIDKTCLSGAALRKTLGDFPCQVLLMLDACHSGAFGNRSKGYKGVLADKGFKPATDDLTRELTEDDVGVAVMCAAMGHEKAQEYGGHGLFTRAVVDALNKAEGVPFNPYNHQLYIHHLHSYVLDQVAERSGGEQHPFLSLPWVVESFPVVKFAKRAPAGGR